MAIKPQFKSTTLEGAFLEAAFLLQRGEINYHIQGKDKGEGQIDPDKVLNYINITIDTDQQRAVIVATIPVGIKSNSFGGYLIAYQFITNEDLNYIAEIPIQDGFY